MNEKQQQLTFEKGITNVPSDALCSDNTLEESVGMVYDNGEHRVIQNPEPFITEAYDQGDIVKEIDIPTILYIHKYNDQERYIYRRTLVDEQEHTVVFLAWGKKNGAALKQIRPLRNDSGELMYDSKTNITSIGKTLLVSDSNGLHYFIWDIDTDLYKFIGDTIPMPTMKFWLEGSNDKYTFPPDDSTHGHFWYDIDFGYDADINLPNTIVNKASTVGIIVDRERSAEPKIEKDAEEKYNDLIVGLYAKNKKAVCEKKAFCEPFFIRYALRLYDDSLYYISNPILLFPSVTGNTYFMYANDPERIIAFTKYCNLFYSLEFQNNDSLDDFSDIIKDVDIFISDGINIYDTISQQKLYAFKDEDVNTRSLFDGIYHTMDGMSLYRDVKAPDCLHIWSVFGIDGYRLDCLLKKDRNEIARNIKEQSIYYKICSVGLKPTSGNISEKIESHTLENLTTQESLEYDDYYSRCSLQPEMMFAYNSRLNLAGVSRGFFEGYDFFMPYKTNASVSEAIYEFYVTIRTDQGVVTVKHQTGGTGQFNDHVQGIYFFYPDSRARHVTIMKTENGVTRCVCNAKLEEHGGLNGAYYFKGLPGVQVTSEETVEGQAPTYDNSAREMLPNYIITSEVNNPWVFGASGYNKVGTGKIIGMATCTMALSQDSFGRTDLVVFSESGVWGMSVNSTGLYDSVHPFSREVCNNAKSITQIDHGVFFSSEKGLMLLTDQGVRCVSEQLSGRNADFTGEVSMGNFRDYLKNCFIAYDYRDSLLWIFNDNRLVNNNYCYVYSIKTGTFGKYSFDSPVNNVVNNYPDYLVQNGIMVYSLTGRKNINLDDEDDYSGLLITRPMKLENGLALKSLMQIRHIKQMQGSMTMRIFASNNLDHWVELHSLRGTPWKYYRFRFDFADMMATDRFAGTLVVTQERRTNKLR